MSDLKQARALLEAAEQDVWAVRGMGDPAVFADAVFGFHVQQAVEKSFKAWLALSGTAYPLIHDLRRLLATLAAREPEAARFNALIQYTPYAVQLRYAGFVPDPVPLDRATAAAHAEALLDEVRRRLDEGERAQ